MSDGILAGLYRTTAPMPGHEDAIPAGVLVYVGDRPELGRFVVRPGVNRKNRWRWSAPVVPLPDDPWTTTLRRLRPEGFYTLPEPLTAGAEQRWLKNTIVQLGYNPAGRGILFVAEAREAEPLNALFFASTGRAIDDELLDRLVWAPIRQIVPPLVDPN